MIDYPLQDSDKSVLEQLVADGESEDKSLDYKKDLPRGDALYGEIRAFANTCDGDETVPIVVESREGWRFTLPASWDRGGRT